MWSRTIVIQPEGCGLYPCSLECLVVGFYEHGNELVGSAKKGEGKIIGLLSDCQLILLCTVW